LKELGIEPKPVASQNPVNAKQTQVNPDSTVNPIQNKLEFMNGFASGKLTGIKQNEPVNANELKKIVNKN